MLEIFVIICLVLVVYTYAGHPVLLYLWSRFFPRPWAASPVSPPVAVFVSAFNEERDIAGKLANLLAQDYPDFVAVIANDGSTDGTARIVSECRDPRVRLFDFPVNRGKAAMENEIVPRLDAEIVVFSDATCQWEPDTLRSIAANFGDPQVGGVAVDLAFQKTGSGSIERGQGAYWKYERFLRIHGARVWTNIVVSGTTYAIRRRLFKPIALDVPEDLANPLHVALAGYRVVFDPTVIIKETSATSHAGEYRMRTRIATRNVTALFLYWRYLHPKYGFAAYQLLLHKLSRIFCWAPMILALFLNMFLLHDNFFVFLFILQLSFYAAAITGFYLEKRGRKVLFFYAPYYFVLLNWACMVGFLNYCRGIRRPTWKTCR